MKDTRRALRRHHRQRMIARTLRSFVCSGVAPERRLQCALHWYNNRQRCSCYLCGNRRRWEGPTVQERRQLPTGTPDVGEAFFSDAVDGDVPIARSPEEREWLRLCRAYHWRHLRHKV